MFPAHKRGFDQPHCRVIKLPLEPREPCQLFILESSSGCLFYLQKLRPTTSYQCHKTALEMPITGRKALSGVCARVLKCLLVRPTERLLWLPAGALPSPPCVCSFAPSCSSSHGAETLQHSACSPSCVSCS